MGGGGGEKNKSKKIQNHTQQEHMHIPAGGCHFLYILHPDRSILPSLPLPADRPALAAPSPSWLPPSERPASPRA